jgi:AcrR family transcriptional regulator
MDRRVAKTRETIRQAYFDLVLEKGGKRVTVSEIARKANIDRKTFYLHYQSTEEIIEEFAEEKTSEMLLRLTTKSFFRRSFDRRIFAEEANSLLRENMDLCRALSSNPDYYFFWRGVEDTVVRHLINSYGRLTRTPASDIIIRVSFFVSGAAGVYRRWFRGEIDCTLEEATDRMSEIAFEGARSLLKSARKKNTT